MLSSMNTTIMAITGNRPLMCLEDTKTSSVTSGVARIWCVATKLRENYLKVTHKYYEIMNIMKTMKKL